MERHPVIGYYHLTFPNRASEFLKLLHPLHFYLLSMVVKYHDVPGVINTGEGSLMAALDFFPAVTNAETKEDITDLFYVFNIADMKASVKTDEEFTKNALNINEDYYMLKNHIRQTGNQSLNVFRKDLLQSECSLERNIHRVCRLLRSGDESLMLPINDIMVETALHRIMSNQLHVFCSTFPLVNKIDYFLGFVLEIKKQAIEKYSNEKDKAARICIDRLISVLKAIVMPYVSLANEQGHHARRIAIQARNLTREQSTKEDMVKTLLEDMNHALAWIAEEVTATFID